MAEKEVFEFDLVVSRARRFGMIFMVLEQLPEFVSKAVATSCRLFMAFGTHGDQVYWTSRLMGLDQDQSRRLPAFPRGTCAALLTGDRCSRPFVMEIERYPHDVINLSQAEVRELAERSLPELRKDVLPRYEGFEKDLQQDDSEQRDPQEIWGRAKRVMEDICAHPMSTISERFTRLRIDRNGEWRAREVLMRFALIEERTVLAKFKVFVPTSKGWDWAMRHQVRVAVYKSGDDHEFVLRGLCMAVCRVFGHLRVKRTGTTIGKVQADALLHSKDGLLAAVQVSSANSPDYEAEKLIMLAQVPEVDRVLFAAIREKTCSTVRKLLEEVCAEQIIEKLVFLKASDVVSGTIDWAKVLPEARRGEKHQ